MLMKEGWEYKELGEVAFYSTNRIPSSSIDEKNYVGVDNLLKDRKGKINATVVPVEGNCISYECGDILVGNIRPYLKKIWLANRDGGASGDVLVIRTNNHQKLQSNYLYWVLANDTFFQYNMLHSKGAKMPRGNKVDILKYIVPIPSFSEQQHIVEELELLSSIIEKKKAQLKELDNLAQSLFYEMFGDPYLNENKYVVKKLGEVCSIERGGSPRPITDYITDAENGINWIKIGDAVEGSKYIMSTAEKIKPEGMKKSRFVHKGDFILSNSMSFGKPYILGVDGCIHDGWLVIHDDNKFFDKSYLYYYLSSPTLYCEFKRLAVGGVVNNLNSKLVRGVKVAIPPINLQHQFASKIEAIEHQKELIKQSIKEVETLFNSRMDYYFN